MKRAIKSKIHNIQKEQYQLVQIENALEKLLGRVNESVNELKVEELQIKSSLIEQFTQQDDLPTTSTQAAKLMYSNATAQDLLVKYEKNEDMHIDENINKQMLALESLLVPIKQNNSENEEEEDDEDDDDNTKEDKDYHESTEDDDTEDEEYITN